MTNIAILDYSLDRQEAAHVSRWLPNDASVTIIFVDTASSIPDDFMERGFTHVIHTGSALSITKPAPFTDKAITTIINLVQAKVAQMGICYGHQLLNLALRGPAAVRKSPKGFEVGWRNVNFTNAINIPGLSRKEIVWQAHFDEVVQLPQGSFAFGYNEFTNIQAFLNDKYLLLGTQFHPEFDSESGNATYLEQRDFMVKHGVDVDELVKSGPSLDTGKTFFGYFLEHFKKL